MKYNCHSTGLADWVLAAFWWHPVLWWARRQLWQAAEQAADEASLWVEEGPVVLASCLLALAQQVQGPRSVHRLGMAGFRSGLGRRIERLLHLDSQQIRAGRCRSDSWICLGASAAFVAMVMIATVWLMPQRVQGQPSLMSAVYQAVVPVFAADGPSGPMDRVKIAPAANYPQSIAVLESPAKDVSPASTNDPSTNPLATITAVSMGTQPADAELGLSNNTLSPEELPPASATTNLEPNLRRARVFKLDPHIIKKKLVTLSGPATEEVFFNDMVQFLETAGVDFSPDRKDRPAIFFKEDTGLLFVNATETDLSIIEQAITFLHQQPPQILLEARFVEISSDSGRESEIDNALGLGQMVLFPPAGESNEVIEIKGLNEAGRGLRPFLKAPGYNRDDELNRTPPITPTQNGRITALLGTTRTGWLTEVQRWDVVKVLERQGGVDIMTAPRVTTLSGRQAQIAATAQTNVVIGVNPEAIVQPGQSPVTGVDPMLTSTVPVGITLDIIPEMEADDARLRLTAISSLVEFLGCDEPSKAKSIQVWDKGRKKSVKPPCPHFRVRQMETQSVLESGQTLMMEALPLTETQTVRGKKKSITKRLLVFVTATLVNPAGNPIVPMQPSSISPVRNNKQLDQTN